MFTNIRYRSSQIDTTLLFYARSKLLKHILEIFAYFSSFVYSQTSYPESLSSIRLFSLFHSKENRTSNLGEITSDSREIPLLARDCPAQLLPNFSWTGTSCCANLQRFWSTFGLHTDFVTSRIGVSNVLNIQKRRSRNYDEFPLFFSVTRISFA